MASNTTLRNLIVASAAVFATLTAAPHVAAQTPEEQQLEETQESLNEAEGHLDEAHAHEAAVVGEYLNTVERVKELNAHLTAAENKYKAAETELAVKERELVAAATAADQAEYALEEGQRNAVKAHKIEQITRSERSARAVDAYVTGGLGAPTDVVLDAGDANETGTASLFADIVAEGFAEAVRIHEKATSEAEQAAIQLEKDVKSAEQKRQEATQAKQQAEQLKNTAAEQRSLAADLTNKAKQEQNRMAELVAEAETQRDAYQTQVAELEEASARAAALLFAQQQYERQANVPPPPIGAINLSEPIPGMVGSGFGPRVHPIYKTVRMHTGLDVGAPSGMPIRAAAPGIVIHAGDMGGYGNAVVVDHGDGLSTLYAHMSKTVSKVGDRVDETTTIGHIGSTGVSTGPHLHWELRVQGTPVDPRPYIVQK